MSKVQNFTKIKLENNIKKLNEWLKHHHEGHINYNDYKKESLQWIKTLNECEKYKLENIEFNPETQFVNYL